MSSCDLSDTFDFDELSQLEKSVVGRTTSGAQASGHITGFIDLTEDLDEQNIKNSDCDVAVRAPYPEERGHMTVSKVSTIPELVRTVFLCRQKKQQTVCSQKPPSVDCPGVYGKGCTGQLRVVYSSFSNGSFWQCSLPPGGERLSCGYRFSPKNDLQNPTVVLAMSDVDKIEVYPAGGAEYFVASCGGVEGILKLAGLDVAAYEGVEISKDHIEFPIKSYQEVSGRLKTLSQISGIDIFPKECDIPQTTKIFFMSKVKERRACEEEVQERFGKLPASLRSALLPFQVEGVQYALSRKGRCLIADEMGVGKTVQAISIAACYRDKWPLLVVVPASLRAIWADEFEKWLPDLNPKDIHLIFGKDDRLRIESGDKDALPKVAIVSYKMVSHLSCNSCRTREQMPHQSGTKNASPCRNKYCISAVQWNLVIADESHVLRTSTLQGPSKDSQQTNAVRSVCSSAEHIIFLTGTPSLNKPFDLFNQINMIRADVLPKNRKEFGRIYCDRRLVPGYSPGSMREIQRYDYSGLSRGKELHLLLKQEVMIRRMKKDVSGQLPRKIRQIIRLPKPDEAAMQVTSDTIDGESNEEETKISEIHRVGRAKCKMCCEWLFTKFGLCSEAVDIIEERPTKVIVFAHHKAVMNDIAACLDAEFSRINDTKLNGRARAEEDKICYVRIDGETLAQDRKKACDDFRANPSVRVALLSVTAASTGLDFCTASSVCFFELPQEPGVVRQAEDRVHRRGQTSAVNIFFLCASSTVDERRWQKLNLNLTKVDSVHDGPTQNLDDSVDPGQSKKGLVVDSVVGLRREDFKRVDLGEYDATQESFECSTEGDSAQEDLSSRHPDEVQDHDIIIIPDSQPDDDNYDEDGLKASDRWKFIVSRHTQRVHIYHTSGIDGDAQVEPILLSVPLMAAMGEACEESLLNAFDASGHASGLSIMKYGFGPLFINKSIVPTKECLIDALNACKLFAREWLEVGNHEKEYLYGNILQTPLDTAIEEQREISMRGDLCGSGKIRHIAGKAKRVEEVLQDQNYLKKYPLLKDAKSLDGRVRHGNGHMSEYVQFVLQEDDDTKFVRLCLHCFGKVPYSEFTQFKEDIDTTALLFCKSDCERLFAVKSSSSVARRQVLKRDGGICSICRLDCMKLIRRLQSIEKGSNNWLDRRKTFLDREYKAFMSGLTGTMQTNLAKKALSGQAWQVDHIRPVFEGGGQCSDRNLRTLCSACHRQVTAKQSAKRRRERQELKKAQQGNEKRVNKRKMDDSKA